MKIKKVFIGYFPVYHPGVKAFIGGEHIFFSEGKVLILIDQNMHEKLSDEYRHIGRDIRALSTNDMVGILHDRHSGISLRVLAKNQNLESQNKTIEMVRGAEEIVAVRDDFVEAVLKEIVGLDLDSVTWDDSVFIRWGKNTVPRDFPITPDLEISEDEFLQSLMEKAYEEGSKSSDWWRRVGTVIFNDKEILFCTHNQHMPTKHTPNIDGDVRSNFSPGEEIDKCQALHAEAAAIARAARDGVPLKGASVLVTTFPCNGCSQLIKESGIKTIYFREGYSKMDAAKLLFQKQGIKIVLVK
jgi:dCMP deaminase